MHLGVVDGQALPEKDYRFVRRTMVSLVLGTDMALHSDMVKACPWPQPSPNPHPGHLFDSADPVLPRLQC